MRSSRTNVHVTQSGYRTSRGASSSSFSEEEGEPSRQGNREYTASQVDGEELWDDQYPEEVDPSDSASATEYHDRYRRHPSRPQSARPRSSSRHHTLHPARQPSGYRAPPPGALAPQPPIGTMSDPSEYDDGYAYGRGSYAASHAPYPHAPYPGRGGHQAVAYTPQSHVGPYGAPNPYGNSMVPYGAPPHYANNPFSPMQNGNGNYFERQQYDMMPYHQQGFYGGQQPGPAFMNGGHMQPYMYQPPPAPPTVAPEPPAKPATPAPPPEKKPDPEVEAMKAKLALFETERARKEEQERQKEMADKIRRETEEALQRRMEDIRMAQEQAKIEIEKAKADAERAARERIDAERKAEEERARLHAEAMKRAEREAREKVEAEMKQAEENRKRAAEAAAEQARLHKEALERAERDAREKLAAELKAAEEARKAAAEAAAEQERIHKEALERAERDAREKLAAELKAAEEARKAAAEAAAEQERIHKEALERAERQAREKLEAELRAAEERAKKEAEAEAQRQKDHDEAMKRAEREARDKYEAEMRAAEEAANAKAEADAAAAAAQKAQIEAAIKAAKDAEEAAAKKAADEAALKKLMQDEANLKAEVEARKKLDDERKAAEEAKQAEEAAKQAKEAEKKRWQEEAKLKTEEAMRKATGEDKAPIKFKDAVGRKFSFPFHLCRTWPGMEELIKQAFLHVEAIGPRVQQGFYDLHGPDREIILPSVWEKVIQPNWSIEMVMWPIDKLPVRGPPMMINGQPMRPVGHPSQQPGHQPAGIRMPMQMPMRPGNARPMGQGPNVRPLPPGFMAQQRLVPGMGPPGGSIPAGVRVVNADQEREPARKKSSSKPNVGLMGFFAGKPAKKKKSK